MNKISSQEYEEVKDILKPNNLGTIEESDRATVSLVDRTESEGVPHLVVVSKNLIKNFNETDIKT